MPAEPLRTRRDYGDSDLESRLVEQVFGSFLAEKASLGLLVTSEMMRERLPKVALKLDELMKRTNSFSRKNAPRCAGSIYRVEKARSRWMFKVKCGEGSSDPGGHIVRLRPMPGRSSQLKDRDILCTCSCPGFLFWGGMYNAQTKDYWEGQGKKVDSPSVMKNLKRSFYICKHVYTALEAAKGFTVPRKAD